MASTSQTAANVMESMPVTSGVSYASVASAQSDNVNQADIANCDDLANIASGLESDNIANEDTQSNKRNRKDMPATDINTPFGTFKYSGSLPLNNASYVQLLYAFQYKITSQVVSEENKWQACAYPKLIELLAKLDKQSSTTIQELMAKSEYTLDIIRNNLIGGQNFVLPVNKPIFVRGVHKYANYDRVAVFPLLQSMKQRLNHLINIKTPRQFISNEKDSATFVQIQECAKVLLEYIKEAHVSWKVIRDEAHSVAGKPVKKHNDDKRRQRFQKTGTNNQSANNVKRPTSGFQRVLVVNSNPAQGFNGRPVTGLRQAGANSTQGRQYPQLQTVKGFQQFQPQQFQPQQFQPQQFQPQQFQPQQFQPQQFPPQQFQPQQFPPQQFQPPQFPPQQFQQSFPPQQFQPQQFQQPAPRSFQQPAQQSFQQPTQQLFQQPAQQSFQQPAQQSFQQPAQQSFQQPTQQSFQPAPYPFAKGQNQNNARNSGKEQQTPYPFPNQSRSSDDKKSAKFQPFSDAPTTSEPFKARRVQN